MLKIVNVNAVLVINKYKDEISIILITRRFFPFVGNLALPGGKLEQGETFVEGVTRELLEETGIILEQPPKLFALLNEIVYQEQTVVNHIVINYFVGFTGKSESELESTLQESIEGDLHVVEIDKLTEMSISIVPSDYKIITDFFQEISKNDMLFNTETDSVIRYYECKVETKKVGDREELTLIDWVSSA